MKKRTYLKKGIEKILITIQMLIIMFIAMTIESIGNSTYNIILITLVIISIIIMEILSKYSRLINKD